MKDERDRKPGIGDHARALESEQRGRVPVPLERYPPETELSPEEEEQIEWEMDQLVRIMGLHLARRPDSADWTDAALLDVLTRELSETPRSEHDWSPEEVIAIRDRILGRLQEARSSRSALRSIDGPAPVRRASVPAPPLVAMEEAALERCTVYIDPAVAAGPGREIWDAECDQWVELPPDVPAGRYVAMSIVGDSMLPLLHAEDAILIRVSPDVASGTIIVARDPDDGYVVKRVGRLSATRVELVSENPAYGAVVIPRSRGAILGTVVLRWCAHAEEPAPDG